MKWEGVCSGKEGQAFKAGQSPADRANQALCSHGCSNLKDIVVCAWFLPKPELHWAGRSLKHCQSSPPSSSDGPAVPFSVISAPNALSRFKGAQTFAFHSEPETMAELCACPGVKEVTSLLVVSS